METIGEREDSSPNSKIVCMHLLTYRQAPVTERELHAIQ